MEQVEGSVVDIVYSNDANGYTVARLKIEDYTEVITGYMPGLTAGENILVEGDWKIHDIYGRQLNVESYEIVVPSTISGILSFLSSGVIKGVGEKTAKRIVEKFGLETINIIQNEPDRH